MANVLKMAIQQAIYGLLEKGWSHRRISRELGVHRETVGNYARKQDSKPAKVPTGSCPKPATVPTGSPKSLCEPFRSEILGKLELGLSAVRIFQDLRADYDFSGSYDSVKCFVRKLELKTPLPFRRMETEPGEEAQVDFGSGYWIREKDKKKRTHVLRITLSHSRKSYSEAVLRQTTDNFIQCLENAFRYFGGVPKTLVVDNLKAAVIKADWFDPELNPKLQAFSKHYGIVILPAKPYTPRHKGKIESGIKYVQNNALKGKVFGDLFSLNRHLLDWEKQVADTRIHGTTKKQVAKLFESEKNFLQTLPSESFPNYQEFQRKVHPDGHVEIARSYYSVPPEYVGHVVWVRKEARLLRIYNHRFEQIAIHTPAGPGRFRTQSQHIPTEKISSVERGKDYLLSRARKAGPFVESWAKAMLEARGIQGLRVLQGLLSFTRKYSPDVLNQASAEALEFEAFRLHDLKKLCARKVRRDEQSFTQTHELIRPLKSYQQILINLQPQNQGETKR